MSSGLIGFLIALVVGALLAFPLSGALKRHAWVFYVVSLAVVVAYTIALRCGVNLKSIRPLAVCLQKGYLALVLLAIVMFTGCFDEGSAPRKRLQPVRGELSILSFIFILGHLAMYAPVYLPRLNIYIHTHNNIVLSLVVALLLTVLFALLTVTSFKFVRRHMNAKVWKAIQRLSYAMVALLALHVALALGASALTGGGRATATLVVYLAVIALYAVLRVRKQVRAHAQGRRPVLEEQ